MKFVLALVLAAAVLALAAPARATEGGMDEGGPETALALAVQALSILEQGLSHEEAAEKLELAIEAENQEGVDVETLRTALAALEAEQPDQAEELLQTAFPEDSHIVGVTFRPEIETARIAAGLAGVFVFAVAVLGLLHQRRADRSESVGTTERDR